MISARATTRCTAAARPSASTSPSHRACQASRRTGRRRTAQTLIIDEGFGSQDEDGIDRLVDAINSVSEEFRLILVVTHVDEMRGRFEQRIEVTKDPEKGSFARVA